MGAAAARKLEVCSRQWSVAPSAAVQNWIVRELQVSDMRQSRNYGHDQLLTCAAANPELCLWTRCLISDPSWQYLQPVLGELKVWEIHRLGNVLDGECYGDGSGRFPGFARLRRCGWGLVCYTRGKGITASLHGPLPGLHQDVPLAESYAF